MAGLGRRKGKAPVVTPEGLDRGKVGIRNRKLRAVCAFSNTQTVRFRYRDISANWWRRGAPRSGSYLRGGRSASYGLLRPRGWASDIRGMVRFLRRRGRGQGKALTFGGRCRNLRCTEPRAKSSGYGDLIELVAAALSEGKGRMCGGSAASSAFAGGSVCSLATLLAR